MLRSCRQNTLAAIGAAIDADWIAGDRAGAAAAAGNGEHSGRFGRRDEIRLDVDPASGTERSCVGPSPAPSAHTVMLLLLELVSGMA